MALEIGTSVEVPSLEILGPHGPDIAPLFTRPLKVLHRVAELYTARTCLLLLLDLGWEARLRQGTTLEALCLDQPNQVQKPLAWMLPFLVSEELLQQEGARYFLRGQPDLELAGLREIAETEAPGHHGNFDLLDGVRTHLRPFFTEGRAGEELLFGLTLFPHWLSYFHNENLAYFPNNLLALLALRDTLPEGARVLELGAGAGSFAQLVAQRAAREGWLSRIRDYCFTDVTPTFLRRAQRELKASAPGLPFSFQTLDLNQPLDGQGIKPHSLDAIVGINVLHVARDLEATLRDLRSHLSPGGRLIIGECVKADLSHPLYLEFFFNFIRSFTDVQLNAQWRPVHGFLSPECWALALRQAGFEHAAFTPPPRPLMDQFPTFNATAITAWD